MQKSSSTLTILAAALLAAGTLSSEARAASYEFSITGPGLSGSFVLTYGSATDATYPQAFEVTGISGTFSDSNNGLNIVNAAVGPLVAITRDTPEPTNLLAPNDFSRFMVAAGLDHGLLSYSNLYYPGGSPQTASDYPPHGGFLDIYGLLFEIGGGRVVNLWSNGVGANGIADYGVAVASSSQAFDYVVSGVSAVPEPSTLCMLGLGVLGLLAARWRASPR